MNAINIIEKYYKKGSNLHNIIVTHSSKVRDKALWIGQKHPELNIDAEFVSESAMIHDIGIFLTDAPRIECGGSFPYISHGYLGRELIEKEGYPIHALVCERHTGVGLSVEEIIAQGLPLPIRDMQPISIEEKVVCFADCFYSKTQLEKEKTVDKLRKGFERYGAEKLNIFESWCEIFL